LLATYDATVLQTSGGRAVTTVNVKVNPNLGYALGMIMLLAPALLAL